MRISEGVPRGRIAELYNPGIFDEREEVIVFTREDFNRTYSLMISLSGIPDNFLTYIQVSITLRFTILKELKKEGILDREAAPETNTRGSDGFIYSLKDNFKVFLKIVAGFEKFYILKDNRINTSRPYPFGRNFIENPYAKKYINYELIEWAGSSMEIQLTKEEQNFILKSLEVFPAVLYALISYQKKTVKILETQKKLKDTVISPTLIRKEFLMRKLSTAIREEIELYPQVNFPIEVKTIIKLKFEEKEEHPAYKNYVKIKGDTLEDIIKS